MIASATLIRCNTPTGIRARPVAVLIDNGNGTSAILQNGFTYQAAPSLASITPNHGPITGGTLLNLNGGGFRAGASVHLGSTLCANTEVLNSETIRCTSPLGTPGSMNVAVINSDLSSSTITSAFTFDPAPNITSVLPTTVSQNGGSWLTISGTGFLSGASVLIGSDLCANTVVVSPTLIQCITPPSATTGARDLKITNSDGQNGTSAGSLTYSATPATTPAAPIALAVSPLQGSLAGGTLITITGQNFVAGDTVKVGTSDCTPVTFLSITTIRCKTPARAQAGPAPIIVSHADGTAATIFIDFLYSYAPEIRSAQPNSLSVAGGDLLSIDGNHFMPGATVSIGGTPCNAISVPSASQIRCTSPALAAGSKSIVVINSDTQSITLANAVIYRAVSPTVTNVSPYYGPTGDGTTITITGTNFVSGTSVTLNDRSCTSVTVATATTITCTTPALPGGTWATLRVIDPNGLSTTNSEAFFYNEAPVIYSVDPAISPTSGNRLITLSGSGFLTGSTLTVGGNNCGSLQVLSPTLIRCTTAAHAAGSADIILTSADGQSATLAGSFQFVASPTLTTLSPAQGPLAGGNTVLFTGSGFKFGLVLDIGGNLCTSISYLSSTSAVCTVPAGVAVTQVNATITNNDGQSATLNNAYRYTPQALALTCNTVTGDYNSALTLKPCTESNPETGTLTWSLSGCSGVTINASNGTLSGNVPSSTCTATITLTNNNVAFGINESVARTITISPYISLSWGTTASLNEQCLLSAPGVITVVGGATWNAAAGSSITKATVTTGTSTGVSGTLTDFNLGSFTTTWTGQSSGPMSAALSLVKTLQLTTGIPPYIKSTATNVNDYLGGKIPGSESNRQGCGALCERQTIGNMTVGGQHVCALSDDGIKCWGRGDLGQIGQGTTNTVSTPTSVYTDGNNTYASTVSGVGMTAIATAYADSSEYTSFCTILTDKTVACWGHNALGQLGDGTADAHWAPKRVLHLANVSRIDGGHASFCALRSEGSVWCWGYNGDGRVGDGTLVNRSTPSRVPGISNATDIGMQGGNGCAVANGRVYCWGTNDYWQLADGTTNPSFEPLQIPNITTAVQVRVGLSSACALLTDGNVKCWGRGDYGQLGNGAGTSSSVPVTVSGGSIGNIVEISSGHLNYYARNAAGNVWAWGHNGNGEAGDGTSGNNRLSAVRTLVIGVTVPATKLRAGRQEACAIADAANNYALYCWGFQGNAASTFSALGFNGTTGVSTPTVLAGMSNALDVAAEYFISGGLYYGFGAMLKRDNSLWQWGWNGEAVHSGVPIVGRYSANLQVAAGRNHNCALLSNGRVRCWGSNSDGQLGDGTQTTRTSPTGLSGDSITSAISVTAGAHHSCALMSTTQKIKCWGMNRSGQLGDITTTMRLVPTDVSLGADLGFLVAAGGEHTCALTQNAGNYRTKCWGQNISGQLGNGNNSSANSPQDVLKATDSNPLSDAVLMLATGNDHSCALLSDQTVMCWGNNTYGQLGDGSTVNNNKAVMVTGLSDVVAITAGFSHTCALTKEMQVKCWGSNIDGSLGDGTTTARSTPTLVTEPSGNALSRVLSVEAGDHVTCAMVEIANDGADMRCWGNGAWGQMGNNTTTMSHLNPITVNPLSGTEWTHQRGCRSYVVTSP